MSSQTEVLRVKKLSERAILPVRGSEFAAGYDLSSAEDTIIPARGKGLVKTDLAIAVPENTYARVAPRSGLALKKFIDTGAGVIDYDYRGNVGVVLFNHSDEEFPVQHGDRIAQLILERISMAALEEVDTLPATERGDGGFGSTGVSHGAAADHNVKKQRTVDASDLVLFLHEAGLSFDDDAMKRLKKMALEKDERFVAAYCEFQVMKNKDALNDTLNIVLGM